MLLVDHGDNAFERKSEDKECKGMETVHGADTVMHNVLVLVDVL